jgi:hypothetical protein
MSQLSVRFLTKIHVEITVKKPKHASDNDSDLDLEATPRKKHKKAENTDSRPDWTKSTEVIDL